MNYSEIPPSDKFSDFIQNHWTFDVSETDADGQPFLHTLMPENNAFGVIFYDSKNKTLS